MTFTRDDILCAKYRLAQIDQPFISMKQLSDVLAVSVSTISQYSCRTRGIRSRIIPRIETGNATVLFDPDAIEKLLDTRARELPTPNRMINARLLPRIIAEREEDEGAPPKNAEEFADAVADRVIEKLIAGGYVVKRTPLVPRSSISSNGTL